MYLLSNVDTIYSSPWPIVGRISPPVSPAFTQKEPTHACVGFQILCGPCRRLSKCDTPRNAKRAARPGYRYARVRRARSVSHPPAATQTP